MTTNSPDRATPAPEEYLTPREAAEMARLSLRTLARLADRGEVDAYELPSGHRRYLRSSIEELTQIRRRSA